MSEPVTQYLANLAAIMRRDAKAMHQSPPAPLWERGGKSPQPPFGKGGESAGIDTRDNRGIQIFLPADPADHRPELDALAAMVREGCRGVVDLDDEDWRVVCDELTFQIARYLAKHESIKLPNLGVLDIAYGKHGPVGRLTLAPEARP